MIQVDSAFPTFTLPTYNPTDDSLSEITNQDFKGSFFILFFYPADFTFVCPTEIADLHNRIDEFNTIGANIVIASTDSVYSHKGWVRSEALLKDITFPMASDRNGALSRELGIYDEKKGVAARAAYIVDPDNILRVVDITSDSIGRSAGELLRKTKALMYTKNNTGHVCPASWDEGSATLQPSIKISGKIKEELEK